MSLPSARQAWIDHVRTLMIVLVVNMHACVTCSHVGSWYVMVDPEPALPIKVPFVFWQGHLQAFFMGLLFFLAGIFAPASLEQRGPLGYLRERATRLGLPALLYMLVIHPFMVYVLLGHPRMADRPSLPILYWNYLVSGRVLSGSGPLWFALALLVFCLVFVMWHSLGLSRKPRDGAPKPAPSTVALFGFGVGLVLATFAVRIVQPIGTNVLNFQLCYFPQYIAAFVAGLAGGQRKWVEALVMSRRARLAGWLGLVGGPSLLGAVLFLGGLSAGHEPTRFLGGWHWQALALATWEQLAGLGLALGVLALFRQRFNGQGRFGRWLSERAFAVYALHAPVLVALTKALDPLPLNPFSRAAWLTVLGVAASFAVADVAKRLPGLRAIL
jgi:fucose 4-O-acetylase-like acetyltransferase